METSTRPQLHIRFQGRSVDVPLDEMDIGDLSSDQQIKQSAASHLEIPESKLAAFTVDRNSQTGDITLRPDAVFGA